MPKKAKETKKPKSTKKDKKSRECPDCKVFLWAGEIQGGYDGTSFWSCPKCGRTWDRWTEKEVKR